MKRQIYITNQERENCRKVVAVFHEFLQQLDILALDAGKYGYVLLKYLNYNGFEYIQTYINSDALFDALWREWLEEKIIELYINTSIINLDFDKMYDELSVTQQNEIQRTKESFKSQIKDENATTIISTARKSDKTDLDKIRCETIAQIFRKKLEKNDIIILDTGKYGFVMLEYYKPIANFDCAIIFKNSQKMFDTLLDEWYQCLITDMMKEQQVKDIDIDDFYNRLPEEEKTQLENRKNQFAEEAMKVIRCQELQFTSPNKPL